MAEDDKWFSLIFSFSVKRN